MTSELILRAGHFIGIMLLFASLLSAHILTRPELPRREIRRIAVLDLICGLAALLVLAMGLLLWFAVGKGAGFYSHNGLFHGKLTVFVIVGLLAIRPTLFWRRQRRGPADDLVAVPAAIRVLQSLQLLLILLLPVLGVLVARGIGQGGP
jgi:putative membrane protein